MYYLVLLLRFCTTAATVFTLQHFGCNFNKNAPLIKTLLTRIVLYSHCQLAGWDTSYFNANICIRAIEGMRDRERERKRGSAKKRLPVSASVAIKAVIASSRRQKLREAMIILPFCFPFSHSLHSFVLDADDKCKLGKRKLRGRRKTRGKRGDGKSPKGRLSHAHPVETCLHAVVGTQLTWSQPTVSLFFPPHTLLSSQFTFWTLAPQVWIVFHIWGQNTFQNDYDFPSLFSWWMKPFWGSLFCLWPHNGEPKALTGLVMLRQVILCGF